MKKYRIAKLRNSSTLGMLQKRICVLFWIDLTPITLTSFHLIKDEEYDMGNFLNRFGLLICKLIGACLLCFSYVVLVPMIGEWIKGLNVDNKWIIASVVLFVGVSAMAVHHVQQRADKEWLTGKYDDEIK